MKYNSMKRVEILALKSQQLLSRLVTLDKTRRYELPHKAWVTPVKRRKEKGRSYVCARVCI